MDGRDTDPQEPTEILAEHDETVVLDGADQPGWGGAADPEAARSNSTFQPAAPRGASPFETVPPPGDPKGYVITEEVRDASSKDRRTRSALVIVAVVAGLILVAGLITAAVTRPSPVTTTSTATPTTETTAAPTTTVPAPTSVAPATTETTTTTAAPPVPAVTLTVSPPEWTCGTNPSENTAVVSWATTDASTVTVVGPAGSLSSEKTGSRIVGPSRSCEDLPPEGFTDTYSATGQNTSGVTQRQASIRWLPST